MQLYIRRLTCLALLAGVLAMATMASDIKIVRCCTKVSTTNVTAPILGYRIQRKKLPCVRAVIFVTTEGEVCSHLKQNWVLDKIRELNRAHKAKNTTPVTTSKTSSP